MAQLKDYKEMAQKRQDMLDSKKREIGDLIIKNEMLYSEIQDVVADNKILKGKLEVAMKDVRRICQVQGKDYRNADQFINWLEFKLADQKIAEKK